MTDPAGQQQVSFPLRELRRKTAEREAAGENRWTETLDSATRRCRQRQAKQTLPLRTSPTLATACAGASIAKSDSRMVSANRRSSPIDEIIRKNCSSDTQHPASRLERNRGPASSSRRPDQAPREVGCGRERIQVTGLMRVATRADRVCSLEAIADHFDDLACSHVHQSPRVNAHHATERVACPVVEPNEDRSVAGAV